MTNHPGDPRSDANGEIPFNQLEYPYHPYTPPAPPPQLGNVNDYQPFLGSVNHGVRNLRDPDDGYAVSSDKPYASDQAAQDHAVDQTSPRDLIPVKPVPVTIIDRPDLLRRINSRTSTYRVNTDAKPIMIAPADPFRTRLVIQAHVYDEAMAYLSMNPDSNLLETGMAFTREISRHETTTTDAVYAYALSSDDAGGSVGTTLVHNFAGTASGATAPTITQSGHHVYWDGTPYFTGNDFTSLTPGAAVYFCSEDLGSKVKEVEATFKFAPNGGGDGGLCCIAIPDRRWAVANINNTNMGLHFWVTPTTWALTVWVAGTGQVVIDTGSFVTRLTADGMTEYRMAAVVDGSTATITLPDGTQRTKTDPRFSSLSGNFAFFESMTNAATDDLACISSVRAATVPKSRPTLFSTWAETPQSNGDPLL